MTTLASRLGELLGDAFEIVLRPDQLGELMPGVSGPTVARALLRSGIGRRQIRPDRRWVYVVERERLGDIVEPLARDQWACPICDRAVSRRPSDRQQRDHVPCVMIAEAPISAQRSALARGRGPGFAFALADWPRAR